MKTCRLYFHSKHRNIRFDLLLTFSSRSIGNPMILYNVSVRYKLTALLLPGVPTRRTRKKIQIKFQPYALSDFLIEFVIIYRHVYRVTETRVCIGNCIY
jgi:hypothetical protein